MLDLHFWFLIFGFCVLLRVLSRLLEVQSVLTIFFEEIVFERRHF
jgi:hypothetical protein